MRKVLDILPSILILVGVVLIVASAGLFSLSEKYSYTISIWILSLPAFLGISIAFLALKSIKP